MKCGQWLAALAVVCLPITSAFAQDHASIGVLVLAHGGQPEWNKTLHQTVEAAALPYPTEIALGMGMHGGEVEQLQQAVSRLEASGVTSIIVVPMLVSSNSEVIRQLQYLLGLRPDGPWSAMAKPVTVHVPIAMTPALDDDPVVAQVLQDRARSLSQDPAKESVVLVAHGPNDEKDDHQWLTVLRRVAERLKQAKGFRAVIPVTMRDDAPEPIRQAAIMRMRQVVEEAGRRGAVLVVPVLISKGGIEQKIPERLQGLNYRYDGATLLPDPLLAQWIARRVHDAETGSEAGSASTTAKTLLQ